MIEEIEQKRSLMISEMNLPEWLSVECGSCKSRVGTKSILSIGIDMTPKMFGNLAVSYLCGGCSSLIEMHFVKAVMGTVDIASVLGADEPPSEPVSYVDLVSSMDHNLI